MFSEFKNKILEKKLDNEQLFQKFFIDDPTYFFCLKNGTIDLEYELKMEFANILCIHMNDIYIVGSAKTGFSMKPKCRGRGFDGDYLKSKKIKNKSDIDVAVVSSSLFEYVQENIYDWSVAFTRDWNSNKYYSDGMEKFNVSLKYKFLEYLGKGWYRPDLAPSTTAAYNIIAFRN